MPRAGFLFDSWTGLFLLKAVSFLETDPLAATRAKPTAGECAVQPEALYKAPRCLRSARRDQTSVGLGSDATVSGWGSVSCPSGLQPRRGGRRKFTDFSAYRKQEGRCRSPRPLLRMPRDAHSLEQRASFSRLTGRHGTRGTSREPS